jgi:hypothetical protein
MLPVARSSRICLFCIHHSSKSRFYASGPVAKTTRAKVKKTTTLGDEPQTSPTVNFELLHPVRFHPDFLQENDTPKPTKTRTPYKSRIESFLEDLDASPKAPTLEDLYSMKPGPPVGPEFPNYAQEYDAALKRVTRAFRPPQLIALANMSGYDDMLPQNHREITQILLERSWNWPPPHIVEQQAKEQVDVVTKGSLNASIPDA